MKREPENAADLKPERLREKADMLDSFESTHNLVLMLREAADTIEGLRDRLREAERAKALLSKSEARKIILIDELERLVCDMVALEKARKSDDFMTSVRLYGEIKKRLEAFGIEGEWTYCPSCRREIKEVER